MITTVTGKNQITIPAVIAQRIGIKNGSRIDWQLCAEADEIRCIVLPDPSTVASQLRGSGKRFLKPGQDPIATLLVERGTDEAARTHALQ